MKLWHEFWSEQHGAFLNSAELILLGAILVIGVVPGIATLRDAIVTEMADMAAAITHGKPPKGDPIPPVHGHDGAGQQIAVASDLSW
jgi:hypothetical protein